jgi:hypothetical protein
MQKKQASIQMFLFAYCVSTLSKKEFAPRKKAEPKYPQKIFQYEKAMFLKKTNKAQHQQVLAKKGRFSMIYQKDAEESSKPAMPKYNVAED